MLCRLASMVVVLVGLPDALPDSLPDSLPPPKAAATAPVTTEVGKAIDQRFLEKWHWRLSPGTCGMLNCTIHGGGWIKAAGEAPAELEVQGHWETQTVNCGPLGGQRANGRFTRTIQVWVEETKLPSSKVGQPDGRPTVRENPGTKPGGNSCPGGVCRPGGT